MAITLINWSFSYFIISDEALTLGALNERWQGNHEGSGMKWEQVVNGYLRCTEKLRINRFIDGSSEFPLKVTNA
jgi:hypothetical protein